MRNIKLTIEYDGTAYHGWQSQDNAVTVQDKLEETISRLTGEKVKVIGASRTDQGVHALGQTANFHTESRIPAEKFAYALNALLPDDIAIKKSEEVPIGFHSRYSATGKKYLYKIYNSRYPSALLRNRAYHVYCPLDLALMQKAAGFFTGTHDFSAFMATGSNAKTTVRSIDVLSLEKSGDIITIEIKGNGFLYNMVRIIAGTLVEVGFGKIRPDDIPGIIEEGDRRKAGRTAPPHGLYLAEVYYN